MENLSFVRGTKIAIFLCFSGKSEYTHPKGGHQVVIAKTLAN